MSRPPQSRRCGSATRRPPSSSRPPSCSRSASRPSASASTASASRIISSRSGTSAGTPPPRCRGSARWPRRPRACSSARASLTPTFRYHPAVVAQAFATLGCLAPGRIFLGLGAGEAMNEVAPTGVEWPGSGERLERLREAVALIRRLWTGRAGALRRPVVPHRRRDDLRSAGPADPDLDRRGWAQGRPLRRRRGRADHDLGEAARAVCRAAAAERGRGRRRGRGRSGRASSA